MHFEKVVNNYRRERWLIIDCEVCVGKGNGNCKCGREREIEFFYLGVCTNGIIENRVTAVNLSYTCHHNIERTWEPGYRELEISFPHANNIYNTSYK